MPTATPLIVAVPLVVAAASACAAAVAGPASRFARGYVADPRFTAYYDRIEDGLAAWLKEIVDANAAAHGVDPATAVWQ
mgnify:CR=1 FL=1